MQLQERYAKLQLRPHNNGEINTIWHLHRKAVDWRRIDFCMIQVAELGGWSYSSASEVKRISSQAPDAGHTERDFGVCHAEFW